MPASPPLTTHSTPFNCLPSHRALLHYPQCSLVLRPTAQTWWPSRLDTCHTMKTTSRGQTNLYTSNDERIIDMSRAGKCTYLTTRVEMIVNRATAGTQLTLQTLIRRAAFVVCRRSSHTSAPSVRLRYHTKLHRHQVRLPMHTGQPSAFQGICSITSHQSFSNIAVTYWT
jgi:hypothetical protein